MLRTIVFRSVFFVVGAAMFSAPAKAQDPAAAQVDRGRQIFQKGAKSQACTTCHAMEGIGAAIGPNLKTLGSVVGPRGLATTIMMSMTCYVQEYTMPNGTHFTGIEKSREGGFVEVWDLTSSPAQVRRFKDNELTAKQNTTWKHPPTAMRLEDQQLADLIAYVKAVSTGTAKEVTVEELH